MQICDADVRIGDSNNHVVPKQDLTPAEILVLREIHGPAAVINIRPTGSENRNHQAEFERLRERYGKAGAMSAEGKPSVVLDRLFPGAVKQLPLRLADIGLGHVDRPEPAAPAPSEEKQNASEEGQGGFRPAATGTPSGGQTEEAAQRTWGGFQRPVPAES